MKYAREIIVLVIVGNLMAHQTSSRLGDSRVRRYARDWWQSASSEERKGFLAGTDDCLAYDLHTPVRFDESWDDYEKSVSQFYERNPRSLNVSAFKIASGKLGLKRRDRRVTPTEYGHDWWRKASNAGRRGFIEGLTSCRSESKHKSRVTMPPDDCVGRLNEMYDVGDVKHFDGSEYQGEIANAVYQWCVDPVH